jgi:16S rRNA (uracil1498-N3)-methyltransferase
VHLSNIELYYTSPELIKDDVLILSGDEFHHSVNVMRNSIDDLLYVTNGAGSIFKVQILKVGKNELTARIINSLQFENKLNNIWFCIPILKNPDRLKYAFEKCVELGITNFILFSSKHSISKKVKPEKFQNTLLSAMKQSLRAFLPKILSSSFNSIIELDGSKIIFDQNANKQFDGKLDFSKPTHFLFGPEGGFDNTELESVSQENRFSLTENRLRSETAIIKCASLLKI